MCFFILHITYPIPYFPFFRLFFYWNLSWPVNGYYDLSDPVIEIYNELSDEKGPVKKTVGWTIAKV